MNIGSTTDCLVIGGGVIGLSTAWELAGSGATVRLLERAQTGREASWAGAGILPPGSWFSDHPALVALAAVCRPLHSSWSQRLADLTGVDDEYEECGALYDVNKATEDSLDAKFARWQCQDLAVRRVSVEEAAGLDPEIRGGESYFVPGEAQVRNPRRLEALRLACVACGVQIETGAAARSFRRTDGRLNGVETDAGVFSAGAYCLAAGAWAGALANQLRVDTPTRPIRGQMLLLKLPEQRLRRVYHNNGRYLVPRRDGHVLVGSTVEDTGFDKSTDDADLQALLDFAHESAPCLRGATVEGSWAGLRPATGDGLPMIGRLPGLSNAWIAAGHFRSGLQFAPATAIAVRQLLAGEPTLLDTRPFAPERFRTATSA